MGPKLSGNHCSFFDWIAEVWLSFPPNLNPRSCIVPVRGSLNRFPHKLHLLLQSTYVPADSPCHTKNSQSISKFSKVSYGRQLAILVILRASFYEHPLVFEERSPTMETIEEKNARVGSSRPDSSNSLPGPAVERNGLVDAEGITRLSEVTNLKDTAYAFSSKKKWWILTVVALCQTSMSRFFLSLIQFRISIFTCT